MYKYLCFFSFLISLLSATYSADKTFPTENDPIKYQKLESLTSLNNQQENTLTLMIFHKEILTLVSKQLDESSDFIKNQQYIALLEKNFSSINQLENFHVLISNHVKEWLAFVNKQQENILSFTKE